MGTNFNFLVTSCDKDGGVYKYSYSEKNVSFINKIPLDRPSYMIYDKDRLHVLIREMQGSKTSGLVSIENNTVLSIVPTQGENACHLCSDGENIFCVNYNSGSVAKISGPVVQHKGKGVHPIRQTKPHTHFAGITPDNKYVLVTDLGTDSIYTYDKNLNCAHITKCAPGSGVRHLAYHNGYYYSSNELSNDVSVYSYNDGKLEHIKTHKGLPDTFHGENTMSAIRIYNGYIYCANRGHNSIVSYKIEDATIKLCGFFDCRGNFPRDIYIKNDILMCANQYSDSVTFFQVNNGILHSIEAELNIKCPLCIITN